MTRWSGLTWDHPRGVDALVAATTQADAPCPIDWDTQPLEGFESASIAENAQAYDLLVIDHPHVGEAVEEGVLRPLGEVFTAEELEIWRADSVGPSFASYDFAGEQWALPLDVATQVGVVADPTLPTPSTWDEAVQLAAQVPSTMPTSGPHLFLTLCAIAVSHGHRPGEDGRFLPADVVDEAVRLLTLLTGAGPFPDRHNPIDVLEAMSRDDGPMYCAHTFGYVNYTRTDRERPLRFVDAPIGRSGRRGSVLGGTGIALSRRCVVDDTLLNHLRWLMSERAQTGFVPRYAGQPSAITAWESAAVNVGTGDFYRGTRRSVEQSWVRPRVDAAVEFQTLAARAVRTAVLGQTDAARLAPTLDELYGRIPATECEVVA